MVYSGVLFCGLILWKAQGLVGFCLQTLGQGPGLVGFPAQSHLLGANQLLCLSAQNTWCELNN